MNNFAKFLISFKDNLLREKPSKQIIEWQHDGTLKTYLKELDNCAGIKQDSKFHQDDVFFHCVKTCDNVPTNPVLRWAALLHDIGKCDVRGQHILCKLYLPDRRIIDYCRLKGKKCNIKCKYAIKRTTFYRHEIASERLAKKILKSYKVPLNEGRKIIKLINGHMYNYTSEWTDRAFSKFINNMGITKQALENWEQIPIFQLRMADRISRGLEPVTQKQIEFIEKLKEHLA